jgi:hypothetical protein
MDLDKFIEELEKLESYGRSGGGGLIGKFDFRVGFFIYSGEVDADEKAYPFEPGNADALEQAKTDAAETLAKYDMGNLTGKDKQRVGPHASYITTFYQKHAKGATAERAEGWQGDRVFALPMWSDAAREIWRPAIKELGLMPGTYWGRLTFAEDPSGRMEQGLDGERVALVAYPAEVYANEAEAEEAAGGDDNESSGLSPKLAKAVKADVAQAVENGASKAKAVKDVATDWQITEDAVLAVL